MLTRDDEQTPLLRTREDSNFRGYSRFPLYGMPMDVWVTVLSYLSDKELALFSRASVLMHQIADNNAFWRQKALRDFLNQPVIIQTQADTVPGLRKKYYRNTLFANNRFTFRRPVAPRVPEHPRFTCYFDAVTAPCTFSFASCCSVCMMTSCVCGAMPSTLTLGISAAIGGAVGLLWFSVGLGRGCCLYQSDMQAFAPIKEEYERSLARYNRNDAIYNWMTVTDTTYYYPNQLPAIQPPKNTVSPVLQPIMQRR